MNPTTNGQLNSLPAEYAALQRQVAELEARLAACQAYPAERLFEQALDLLCIGGFDGYFKRLNPAWEHLLGYSRAELTAAPFLNFVHPDDLEPTIIETARMIEEASSMVSFVNRYRAGDDTYRYLLWNAVADPANELFYATVQDITGRRMAEEALFHTLHERQQAADESLVFQETIRNMPIGLLIYQLDRPDDPGGLRLINANPRSAAFTGVNMEAALGRRLDEICPQMIESGQAAIFAEIAQNGGNRDLGEINYQDERGGEGWCLLRAFGLPRRRVCLVFDDTTQRRLAAEAIHYSRLQEEVIRAQEAALAELSTPLLAISERLLVMPLVGTLDSRRAQQVIDSLLEGVARRRASAVILDITGVNLVDSQVADALMRAAQAVRLLGARVILTGIRPEVAQTLVGLGIDLSTITTRSSLQSGIAEGMKS